MPSLSATKHTLWLQNERYQDQVIIERLVRAARRGVKVHILAKPPHSLKPGKLIEGLGGLRILQDVGVKVHTLKHLKLHAKMLLADSKRAIIGSINIAPGSFDSRRELAIETDDPETVKRLEKTAQHDWSLSHKLDLSDAALLADLKKREGLDPGKLVLTRTSSTRAITTTAITARTTTSTAARVKTHTAASITPPRRKPRAVRHQHDAQRSRFPADPVTRRHNASQQMAASENLGGDIDRLLGWTETFAIS